MADLTFENLRLLLCDMEKMGWTIDSFPFKYNGIDTVVILKRYKKEFEKPTQYAKVKLEFILKQNTKCSIFAYADFFRVHFENTLEFYKFFNIQRKNWGGNLFELFAKYFAQFIPKEKIVVKADKQERELLGSRAEGPDPNAIYCYDVRRSGFKADGTPKTRTPENSQKAAILRPELFERFREDETISFYFSPNPQMALTDEEIIAAFSQR